MLTRPIRWVLWLFGLAALAVAIALAGRYGSGYAVFVIPPWRIELSMMLYVLLMVLAFAFFHTLLRVTRGVIRLRRALRLRRRERARNKAHRALYAALRALFSGQFRAAETHAREAMAAAADNEGTRDIAAAVAAWSAHEGGQLDAAVPYLDAIQGENAVEMRDASKAYMLLAEGRASDALTILKGLAQLAPRNPGVMKMKVEAELAERAWDDVLASLGPLTRAGLMPESAAQQVRLNAELNLLRNRPANREAILKLWESLSKESRFDVTLASTVAARLNAIGCGEDARRVVEATVDARGADGWDATLAATYADCKGESTLAQIDRAERWLKMHARDAQLLCALGKLCMREALWGKAQSYLEASVALEPTLDAHMTLARLMEQAGKHDAAVEHIRKGAELAK